MLGPAMRNDSWVPVGLRPCARLKFACLMRAVCLLCTGWRAFDVRPGGPVFMSGRAARLARPGPA